MDACDVCDSTGTDPEFGRIANPDDLEEVRDDTVDHNDVPLYCEYINVIAFFNALVSAMREVDPVLFGPIIEDVHNEIRTIAPDLKCDADFVFDSLSETFNTAADQTRDISVVPFTVTLTTLCRLATVLTTFIKVNAPITQLSCDTFQEFVDSANINLPEYNITPDIIARFTRTLVEKVKACAED